MKIQMLLRAHPASSAALFYACLLAFISSHLNPKKQSNLGLGRDDGSSSVQRSSLPAALMSFHGYTGHLIKNPKIKNKIKTDHTALGEKFLMGLLDLSSVATLVTEALLLPGG